MTTLNDQELSKLAIFAESLVAAPAKLDEWIELVRLTSNGRGVSPEFQAVLDAVRVIWQPYGEDGPTREEIVDKALELVGEEGADRLAGVALAWAAENSYARTEVNKRLSSEEVAARDRLREWRSAENRQALDAVGV